LVYIVVSVERAGGGKAIGNVMLSGPASVILCESRKATSLGIKQLLYELSVEERVMIRANPVERVSAQSLVPFSRDNVFTFPPTVFQEKLVTACSVLLANGKPRANLSSRNLTRTTPEA
jgi:hypothetical protein